MNDKLLNEYKEIQSNLFGYIRKLENKISELNGRDLKEGLDVWVVLLHYEQYLDQQGNIENITKSYKNNNVPGIIGFNNVDVSTFFDYFTNFYSDRLFITVDNCKKRYAKGISMYRLAYGIN